MFAAMMATQGAFGSFETLWPIYIAALGASPARVGLVLGLTGVLRLGALLPWGVAAERLPIKWVIVGGLLLKVVSLALYAAARVWWQLIPAGALYAVGAVFPAILAEVAAVAGDDSEPVRTFTLLNTVAPSLALLASPALGGLVAARISLHAVFLFAALLFAVAAVLFASLSNRPRVAARELTVSYRSTFSQAEIRRWLLLEMVAIFALGLGMVLVPNYLHDVHGVSAGAIGVFGSLSAAGSIVLGLLVHRVAVLRQPFYSVTLALLAVAAGLVLTIAGGTLLLFGAAYVLFGGFFATWTLFEAILSGVTPPRYRARTYALAELLSGAGYALAPFLAGVLYERDPRVPMLAGLLVTLALVALMVRMRQRGALTPGPASNPGSEEYEGETTAV